MIVKMKFLSITGPKADIDRVVEQYLSKYEIHLENAVAQLSQVKNVSPYIETNPYRDSLNKVSEFAELLGDIPDAQLEKISLEDSLALIEQTDRRLTDLKEQQGKLQEEQRQTEEAMEIIEPFRNLPCDMHALLHFEFVRCRFGRIGRQYYTNFENYIYEHLEAVFFPCKQDEEYVWGVYFAPKPQMHKVNAVFSSMHFERIYLQDIYDGTPVEAMEAYSAKLKDIKSRILAVKNEMTKILQSHALQILSAKEKLEELSTNFDVRKVAGCIHEKLDTFYIICGWMAKSDADKLAREVEEDEEIFCIIEDDQNKLQCKPPTRLKNLKPIRPFEMFVRMYGLPSYNEIDPTAFVAITYAFIFGAMFGDVGQGLLLTVGGFLLYRIKKMDLAAIIGMAGIFSTIFGFLFGSVFGFEDILPALWLRPVSSMMDVPFIGKLNTVFVIAIAFGMGIILVSMVFHIINGIKAKDAENILFDTNALAGLAFYGSAVVVIVLFMTGNPLPGGIVLGIMFIFPLLLILLKEPLTDLLLKKAGKHGGGAVMFVVQGFFELFEIILSYFSNTLSFVRIGAFAVSHAAMMEVVLMLAGVEAGSPNWIVVVLGNLFVCGLEGLIVGIQVLRLEYYEIFSRFYKGTGKEFVSFLHRRKSALK